MTRPSLIDPIERPDIIVPDASPLIHLAQAEMLPLLHQVGRAVILVDVVADEVTRNAEKPGAEALKDWISAGSRDGSNAPVRIVRTETGRAIELARIAEPGFTMRNGGENAIVEWLVDELDSTDAAAIVLYENGRVPRVVAAQAIDADIDILTTRAFLELAQRRGLIDSADTAWASIEGRGLTASPQITVTSQRRPGKTTP